ncbi:MAG: CPBP family intramembrane metalloprotease [Candidatus Lokiarchaeota archaeon]|nr:CPBP family intramembrane metalloprotease [Candidatus Lokiarchaeota archaeon]
MNKKKFYNPVKFYAITLIVVMIPGFLAAYFSYIPELKSMVTLFIAIGLFSPAVIALIMIYKSENNKVLVDDLKNRFFRLKGLNILSIFVVVALMPLSIIISIFISVLMGFSLGQFQFSPEITIVSGELFLSLAILLLAPTLEEIGWRGYGVDALRSKFNLFNTTLIFYVIWSVWHIPLFFIKGYYHNTLLNPYPYYAVNFFLSLLPLVFIMNWLYYKTDRSIVVLILFHFMVNFSAEFMMVDDFTKCIQTFVLLIPAIVIIWKEKDLFFKLEAIFITEFSQLHEN